MTMNFKFALFFGLTVGIAAPAIAQKPVDAPGGKYAKEAEQMFRDSFRADNPKKRANLKFMVIPFFCA